MKNYIFKFIRNFITILAILAVSNGPAMDKTASSASGKKMAMKNPDQQEYERLSTFITQTSKIDPDQLITLTSEIKSLEKRRPDFADKLNVELAIKLSMPSSASATVKSSKELPLPALPATPAPEKTAKKFPPLPPLPAEKSKQTPLAPSTLKIATFNMLNDTDYHKIFRFNKIADTGMPLGQRQQNFSTLINQLTSHYNIVALQEFDAHVALKFGQNSGGGLYTWSNLPTLQTSFHPFPAPADKRGFLVTIVQTADKTPIGFINTHFQGGNPTGNYEQFRIAQAAEIANYIQNNGHLAQHWIIVGDLNSDYNTSAGKEVTKFFAQYKFNFVTSRVGFTSAKYTSSGSPYEIMDYIFYSPGLTLLNFDQNPKTQSELVQYDGNDATRTFPSDHAVLTAEFSYGTPTTSAPTAQTSGATKSETESKEDAAAQESRKAAELAHASSSILEYIRVYLSTTDEQELRKASEITKFNPDQPLENPVSPTPKIEPLKTILKELNTMLPDLSQNRYWQIIMKRLSQ